MVASAKRYMTAFAAAALIAVAVSACGGGGGGGPTTTNGGTTPTAVDLSGLTSGLMADAGTVTIEAGQSTVHGDIEFTCTAGGADCVVMVRVAADGTVSADSTGGMVTAMDSPGHVLASGRSIPQGSASAWADRFDLVANNRRSDGNNIVGAYHGYENSISSNIGSSSRGKHATISHTRYGGSTANVIVSHDENGQLQFNVSIYQPISYRRSVLPQRFTHIDTSIRTRIL